MMLSSHRSSGAPVWARSPSHDPRTGHMTRLWTLTPARTARLPPERDWPMRAAAPEPRCRSYPWRPAPLDLWPPTARSPQTELERHTHTIMIIQIIMFNNNNKSCFWKKCLLLTNYVTRNTVILWNINAIDLYLFNSNTIQFNIIH